MATFTMKLDEFVSRLGIPPDTKLVDVAICGGAVVFEMPGDGHFKLTTVPYQREQTMVLIGSEPALLPDDAVDDWAAHFPRRGLK